MLRGLKEIGGRGFSIVIWCSGILLIVELLLFWALFDAKITSEDFAGLTQLFILMIGAMGGVYQGQNLINAMPGTRKWEGNPNSGDSTITSDPNK